VLVNGGSAKSCVLNAITLALVHAGVQMRDLLVSCTVGNLGNIQVIDPTDEEEYDLTNETIVSYLQNEQKIDCLELRKAKIKQEHVK
jgi:exosome complex component RRP41